MIRKLDPSPTRPSSPTSSPATASRDVLAHVAGKWSVLALLALDEGGYRFNALRRRVQG